MTPSTAQLLAPHSGAGMDRPLPPSRWRRGVARVVLPGLVTASALLLLSALVWQRAPQRQTVAHAQLASVRMGEFRDELPLRARMEPVRSVQLDASEAGRVEAVLAHDGDMLSAGAPLYRLLSPEQDQVLMQRSAEVAQQAANLSTQRSAQAASLAANRRELALLQAAEQQAEADTRRQTALAAADFVSRAALEQTQRQHRLALQLLEQARHDLQLEADIRAQSIAEMSAALQGLQRSLRLLERARDRLLQRAPIAGQLSGFNLQVGASVKPGDRLGRIDDPTGGMQLAAEVDEYHLPRLQEGQVAHSPVGPWRLVQTLPQVQGGRVRALLRPADGAGSNTLRPGQAVELRLQLGDARPALVLPDGPGVQAHLYVRAGRELQRRRVQLGRRAAGQVEVLSGLKVGDEVLISQPPSDDERLNLP